MQYGKTTAIIALSTLLVSTVNPCQGERTKTVEALELQQTQHMSGPQKIILSKTAMRYEHPHVGVVFLSSYPFKTVTVYNPRKRLFIDLEIRNAERNMQGLKFLLQTTGEFTDEKWKAPKQEKFLGLDALVYSKTTPKKSWCKYYVLNDKTWPPRLIRMICNHSALTESFGIPLRLQQFVTREDAMYSKGEEDEERKVLNVFDTTSAKRVTVADSIFRLPPGSKESINKREVLRDAVGYGSYKDMLNTPDFLFQSSTKRLGGPADPRKNDPANQKKRNRLLEQIMAE